MCFFAEFDRFPMREKPKKNVSLGAFKPTVESGGEREGIGSTLEVTIS